MATIIDALKNGNNNAIGSIRMDSHERIEYLHRTLSGGALYDTPCRWIIQAAGIGYTVSQFDLSLSYAEEHANPGDDMRNIETSSRRLFSAKMRVVESVITSNGAYNVYLVNENDSRVIVNILIVKDYIEKIQFIDQRNDSQTIYKSAVDKICFMELDDKRAIYQVAYQMMAGASPTRRLGQSDDKSIDELINNTCYTLNFGNIVWNQAITTDPWQAFAKVAKMDCSAKAAIMLVLVNVARVDNTGLRVDILKQLSSVAQCDLPFRSKFFL